MTASVTGDLVGGLLGFRYGKVARLPLPLPEAGDAGVIVAQAEPEPRNTVRPNGLWDELKNLGNLPAAPRSSPPNRPEIKIFNPPDEYPVQGIDVSGAEGAIDWARVKQSGVTFAYMRGSMPTGADPSFKGLWNGAGTNGVIRGVYHVVSYCQPAETQFERMRQATPDDDSAMPIALAFESFSDGDQSEEARCLTKAGDEDLRKTALDLLERMKEQYKKVPIVYGDSPVLLRILNDRFLPYMVWFASYPRGDGGRKPDFAFAGTNPWTIWQYSGTANVPDIGRNVDLDAFFGSQRQFQQFREGRENVARSQ
jgi:lysozyme